MIKITNGNVSKEVTMGAYETYYKRSGYYPINKKQEQEIKKEVNELHRTMGTFAKDKVNNEDKESQKIKNIEKR